MEIAQPVELARGGFSTSGLDDHLSVVAEEVSRLRHVWDEESYIRLIRSLNAVLEALRVEYYTPNLAIVLGNLSPLRLWEAEISSEELSTILRSLARAKVLMGDRELNEARSCVVYLLTRLLENPYVAERLVNYVESLASSSEEKLKALLNLAVLAIVLATNP